MKITLSRSGRFAWVDDDPDTAIVALLPEIFVEDRKGFSAVCTGNEQHFGKRDITPGVRCAVDTECLVVSCCRGDHAEAAVVINVARSESGAGELAHQVCFLSR